MGKNDASVGELVTDFDDFDSFARPSGDAFVTGFDFVDGYDKDVVLFFG